MEKKITVSAKFNMQEFDRDLRRMQDKLKEIYAPSDQAKQQSQNLQRMEAAGLAPKGAGAAGEEKFQKAARGDVRQLDEYIRKQAVSQDKINKAIDNRTKKIKDLKKEYDGVNKASTEALRLEEEITKNQEKRERLKQTSRVKDEAVSQAIETREGMKRSMARPTGIHRVIRGYEKGGLGGAYRAATRHIRQNPMSVMGAVLGGAATVGAAAVPILRQEDTAERRTLAAQGTAVQGASHMARDIMRGRGEGVAYWMPEQNRAMQSALKEMQNQRRTDAVKMATGFATIGAATIGGAKLGGAAGSVVPGVGNAIGAAVGGTGGFASSTYFMMADEQMRNKFLGGLGFEGRQQRYEAGLVKDMMGNYRQNLEAEKNVEPFKRLGREYYERTGARNLQAQRTLGLRDTDFYGEERAPDTAQALQDMGIQPPAEPKKLFTPGTPDTGGFPFAPKEPGKPEIPDATRTQITPREDGMPQAPDATRDPLVPLSISERQNLALEKLQLAPREPEVPQAPGIVQPLPTPQVPEIPRPDQAPQQVMTPMSENQAPQRRGYLERVLGAGFTEEQGLQMSQGIMGAGGSTRMAREPERALPFVRQMGLTNAGGVMGKLSGTLGDAQQSEQATIKILAEGMKIGLDSSQFAEEQRKFASSVSQIVYGAGVKTEEEAGAISATFSKFMTDRTTRGIEGAKSAYRTFQDITAESTGIRGAIQAANIMNDPNLSKMGLHARRSLADISEEQINAGGNMIEEMANQSGLDLDAFKKAAIKSKRGSIGLIKDTDKLITQYQSVKNIANEDSTKAMLGQIEMSMRFAEPDKFKGKSRSEAEALVLGVAEGAPTGAAPTAGVTDQLEGPTGRMGDVTEMGVARGQEIALGEFRKIKADLEDAAKAASTMTTGMMQALSGLAAAVTTDGEESVKKFGENIKLLNEEMERQRKGTGGLLYTPFEQPTGAKGEGG